MSGVTTGYDAKVSPHSPEPALAALAGRQHGIVSAGQLRDLGLGTTGIRRRLEAGRLHRLHRGVYAVGHTALTARSHELAAVLACGSEAVLSHRSAAALWGMLRSAPGTEVTAPRSGGRRPGMTIHRSRRLHPDDRAVVDAVPVTSVARTIVDLAEVLDERRLAQAVHEAEVLRSFDLRAVGEALSRVPGRTGRHRLGRVLAGYGHEPFTRSEAERRFLALCRRHGIPEPRVNACVGGYEVDFLWPDARLVVEVDGAAFHHTRRAFHSDRRGDRALATLGVQAVRITWRDLCDRPDGLAADLLSILARRT